MIDQRFFGEIKKIKATELAVICGFKVFGDRDFVISSVATLKHATENDLSFFGNKKYKDDLRKTKAGAVIVSEADLSELPENVMALVSPNVMVGYAKALTVLCHPDEHLSHICQTAVISETAKIGANCYIGDYVKIEDDVEIGDNVVIGCNTVIEKGCKIGDNGLIRNNVTISHSIIGCNVIINSGARIGESGFGIIPTGSGMVYVKQLGRVVIGDRVRIGANTTIDRGSIEDTVIGNDTIIDNLVQIAHNVTIGNQSVLVSQVGIAGSSKIGNGVILAGQVGVAGHIEIGDGAIAAAKSGIASSIEPGKIVGGIPAVDAGIWKRQAAFLKMSVTKKKKN
ncbi:MAG: UDP-3-O-(3-hydroxymyristoyl)glucosamine N-acyltransferase [Alphaproteobacteria bacterium]|nr:UDP-3-O-(3-hydroxymyristoyl)glucosamine N-acyltransferase [Alphaproteobacteria bacterium]MCR4555856.1 UDP-3-O-(3-hydroxymyristoyl)glucosamine N-acyltransferase [Alphaproteobacteria bacterium]